jgi:hypothetical protein
VVKRRLFYAVVPLASFEAIATFTNLTGLSVAKVALTSLVWISLFATLWAAKSTFHMARREVPSLAWALYSALMAWNLLGVLRGATEGGAALTTLLGNVYTALALLVPAALFFGLRHSNLRALNWFCLVLAALGAILAASSLLLGFDSAAVPGSRLPFGLASVVIYLITVLPFQRVRGKIIVIVGTVITLLYSIFLFPSRAMLVRIPFLYLNLSLIWLYRRMGAKWTRWLPVIGFFVPLYLVLSGLAGGDSFFQTSLSQVEAAVDARAGQGVLGKADTRTFLYAEVFDDLRRNSALLTGKGASGRYFSPYFSSTQEDTDQRLTVEVGALAILLKGGFIALALHLAVFLVAIYFATFKSRNQYIMGLGAMLFVHSVLLFVENLMAYNLYNFIIWLFVGACLSRSIRAMSNAEIMDALVMKRSRFRAESLQVAKTEKA